MRYCLTILAILFFTSAGAQKLFDSLQAEKKLMELPKAPGKTEPNKDIIRAIEAVDKKYRQIADTLYYYKSLKHTILQTVFIETNDSVFINPLSFGSKIQLTHILFNYSNLNEKVESISKSLKKSERARLYEYLKTEFDHFSMKDKNLHPQPVRIKYVKFPDGQFVHIGIDIYGAHFLWIADRNQNWDIIKVERLWVY
jgi:hypothetical protein